MLQRFGARRRGPIGPGCDVDAKRGNHLRAPQRKRRRDAPGTAGEEQREEVADGERDGAPEQRPWPLQETAPAPLTRGVAGVERAVAPALEHDGGERDRGEEREVEEQRRNPAQRFDQGDAAKIGCLLPPGEVIGAERRTGDEGGERREHARVAAAGGVERSRGAAAAELHPQPEQERADRDRDADGTEFAMDGSAQHRAPRQDGIEEHDGGREHQHLGAQAGAAPIGNEDAPGGSEAEKRVIEPNCVSSSHSPPASFQPGERTSKMKTVTTSSISGKDIWRICSGTILP